MTLVERLEELTMHEVSDGVYCREMPVPVNRDGPEAAARIRALEVALAPFAKEADGWDADQNGGHVFPDGFGIDVSGCLRVGDLRNARRALLSDGDSGEGRLRDPERAEG